MEASRGTPFGRYRLLERLGRGGMGEVWQAHDTRTDRIVAIKVLHPQFSDDAKFQLRFRREAHSAARIENPHVIPIHDYGEIDGRLYVDMRLIRGADLHSVLAGGPIDPSRAVRIIEQVAKALDAAHQVGLVHRDVKPSNILLAEDDFAYLIDFGIAQAADDTRMTGTGNAIGTFQYMAPERMSGEADDARGDIYALACVLYECVTGQPPFAGRHVASLVAAHLNTSPPRPSVTNPGLPPEFDAVIATGMAKDPGHRYATTVELAAAAIEASAMPTSAVSPAKPREHRRAVSTVKPPTRPSGKPSAQPTTRDPLATAIQPAHQPAVRGTKTPARRRRPGRRRVVAVLLLPAVMLMAAIVFAAMTVPKYLSDRADADAKRAVIQSASEAIVTLWSYTPDNVDTLVDRTRPYLSPEFFEQYKKFVNESVVAPNKQFKVTTVTQVVGAGIESFSGDNASAIVYTNTTTTTPLKENEPAFQYLSYLLFMQKRESRWVINKMNTITSLDVSEAK